MNFNFSCFWLKKQNKTKPKLLHYWNLQGATSEMAQQGKVLAARMGTLEFDPWTHMVEEDLLLQVVLWLSHTCCHTGTVACVLWCMRALVHAGSGACVLWCMWALVHSALVHLGGSCEWGLWCMRALVCVCYGACRLWCVWALVHVGYDACGLWHGCTCTETHFV